jgi:hypothetical protein
MLRIFRIYSLKVLHLGDLKDAYIDDKSYLLATEVALLRRCDGCCSTSVSDGISIVLTCIITL